MPPRAIVRQRRRSGGLRAVSGVLDKVVERKGWKRSFDKAKLLASWDTVVGQQLARTTKAVEFRKDRESKETIMLIRVQDNTAASFFTLNAPLYLAKLRDVLGDAAPMQLQFTVGKLEKIARTSKQKVMRLTATEQKRIASSLENTPETIRNTVQQAAEAMLQARLERQRNGFVPCPICGTLTEKPEPCAHCRITLRQPLVQNWSSKLIRNPDLVIAYAEPDDIIQCAQFLALEYLLGQLEQLAMQILTADAPELRMYLEMSARTYVALHLKKSVNQVTARDWRYLPERVRGVLEKT